jgi:signal transduction histidine kinase
VRAAGGRRRVPTTRIWTRIALANVAVILAIILLVELVGFAIVAWPYFDSAGLAKRVTATAEAEAREAASRSAGRDLEPDPQVRLGNPEAVPRPGAIRFSGDRLSVPQVSRDPADPRPIASIVLVTPDGRIAASSFPARYPTASDASGSLAVAATDISTVLDGSVLATAVVPAGQDWTVVRTLVPIRVAGGRPIGAVYVASPTAEDATAADVVDLALQVLASTAWLLVLAALIGVVASRITARRLARRLDRLAAMAGDIAPAPAPEPAKAERPPRLRGAAGAVRDRVRTAMRLRPVQLEGLGLAGGLERLARTYRTRLNAPVDVRVEPNLQSWSGAPELELAMLRIAEEGIANAVRHARAGRIELRAGLDHGSLVLVVADDGRGFRPDRAGDRGGTGLELIRERVRELEGSLDVEAAPGRGVRITVTVPLGD